MNKLIYDIARKMQIPFYSAGVAQQVRGDSYIVWQIISDVPGKTIGYASNISKVRVQFDIYSRNEEAVFEIGDHLESVMLGKGFVLLRTGPFFNADTKMYRRAIDISFIRKGYRHGKKQ